MRRRFPANLSLLAALGVGLTSAAQAGTPEHAEVGVVASAQPSASLSPRRSSMLFYDEKLRRLVLLNGIIPPEIPELGQLWAWDGKAWSLVSATGPSMRTVHDAVYDTRRKRIVLFGGVGNRQQADRRDDTWEWDGKKWLRMADTSPGTRDHHSMAYDEAGGRTVLYGGVTSETPPDGTRALAKDTWEWDGKKWLRIGAEGANPPHGGSMTFDRKRSSCSAVCTVAADLARLGPGTASHGASSPIQDRRGATDTR